MKAFDFLLNKREEKPRSNGITMVLDKGLGLETAESLMNISGEYVDYLKFGWGTSIIHDEDIIKAKYGGNGDKTRKKYTDEVLKEEKQQIKDLELRIEHLTRRNEFIREMMAMQRSLIDVGVV